MSLTINKGESIFHLTNEELKIKENGRRKSIQNTLLKSSFIFQNPGILNKSISRLNYGKLRKKSEKKILKDYLHLHKFGLERKKTKNTTIKGMNNNFNRSFLFNNNTDNECVSMIYYPKEKNSRIKNNDIIKLKKGEKQNLKKVENSIINKINNMKFNFQNESMNEDLMFENNLLNINNNSNANSFRSNHSNKNNNAINAYYNNNKVTNISHLNRNAFYSSNLSNNRSSCFGRHNQSSGHIISDLINYPNRRSSEFIHLHFDKYASETNKTRSRSKSTDISKSKNKKTKISNYSVILKEKSRNLFRTNPLYDSFDDEESDKDEKYNENIILPTSRIILFLDLFLFFFSIYCLFYIPLTMAKSNCFCAKEKKINIFLLFFVDILYIFDFCISFFRAYYNYQLKLIKYNNKILINYLKGDFFFDFLEALPIFSYSYFLCIKNEEANYCFKFSMSNKLILIKILTNLKIFKVIKVRNRQKNIVFNYFLNLFSESYSVEKSVGNFTNFFICFLAFHFFVCLNIFLAKQTYPNWLITNNTQDKGFIYNYVISSYSLIETLTTVGYGDVVCQSSIERIFQIFFLAIGVVAYSYLISSFGNLIKNERQSSIKYNNNMKILEEIRVDYPNLPFKLYNKIYNYIETRNIAEKKLDSNELTNALPFNLRNALLLVMYNSCIRNFKIFKGCENSNFIIQILSKFIPSTNKKSEIIVYEGEMIEEIVIVKDGRLSLEAAIDTEDPESSIRKYFNISFEGITTAKEIKKLKNNKKDASTILITSKKSKDFDRAKHVLSSVVKKEANFLLNDACEDTSLFDRTKNDNTTNTRKEKEEIKNNNTGSDYLKNEPIKNEKGNFKYIKIIDIRKNENFGGLYMFMRRPSPLSLKVKTKFAELYLIPKKDIFEIAKNNKNIWNKIHKKDFHNMLSIKHQTFKILNKYIEVNGIGKINPADISTFLYGWEGKSKKEKKEDRKINNKTKPNFIENNNNNIFCPSPIHINNNPILSFNQLANNKQLNKNKENASSNINDIKTDSNIQNPTTQVNQQTNNDLDFTQLLTLVVNGKQNITHTNSNYNTNGNNNNTNNNTNNNVNTNNLNNNTNTNTNNNNNINNNQQNEGKDALTNFVSNFFNNKQKTYQDNNEDEYCKTMIIQETEKLLPSTLKAIFNENKAQKIKEEMKISKQKETRRKIFNFGKQAAKLFRNHKIVLIDKNKDESFDIRNKNILSSKSINLDNLDHSTYNYIQLNQNKAFLEKIPEFNSEEEYSIHHFANSELIQEEVFSFSFESLYQNINNYTNLEYSKNKKFQQKTLYYLTKLISNKTNQSSSFSKDNMSSKLNKSSSSFKKSKSLSKSLSFSSSYKDKNDINSAFRNSLVNEAKLNNMFNSPVNNQEHNNYFNSEILHKIKKHRNKNNQKKKNNNNDNSKFSKIFNALSPNDIGFSSLNPKTPSNLRSIKSKSPKRRKFKKNEVKYTFKNDTKDTYNNIKTNNNSSLKKDFGKYISLNVEGLKNNKKKEDDDPSSKFDDMSNKKIKNSKTVKNARKKAQIDNKLNIKEKCFKRKSGQPNRASQRLKLENADELNDNKGGIRNSLLYFAKEEKEECKII